MLPFVCLLATAVHHATQTNITLFVHFLLVGSGQRTILHGPWFATTKVPCSPTLHALMTETEPNIIVVFKLKQGEI